MSALKAVFFLLGSVAVLAFLGARVNRLVYGADHTPRKHANSTAAIVGVGVALVWLVGWALALVLLPEPLGRWVWLGISVVSISILNGLRSDFAKEHMEMENWPNDRFGKHGS